MKKTLTITLHHVKNVDLMYGQGNGTGYWGDRPAGPRRMIVEVKDLKEAVRVFVEWRKRNDLGGGNIAKDCGDVMENGKRIARVAYNGRVWDVDGVEIIMNDTKQIKRMARLAQTLGEVWDEKGTKQNKENEMKKTAKTVVVKKVTKQNNEKENAMKTKKTVKKVAAKVAKKNVVVKKATDKKTIKYVVVEALKAGKDMKEILAAVKKVFPKAKTTVGCIAWYKCKCM